MKKGNTKILSNQKSKVNLAKIVPFCLVFAMFCQFGFLVIFGNIGKKVSGIVDKCLKMDIKVLY